MKSWKTSNKQNSTQSELFQPGHEPGPDLHTALEPGSKILQDPKSSKSCSKSELSQPGQEPQCDLHTVRLLNSPYFSHTRPFTAVKLKHYASTTYQNNYLKLSECNETSYLDSNSVYLSHI